VADILFHPEAQAEYRAALAWYQSRSAQAASRFEAEVGRMLGLIADNPALFRRYDADHRYAVLRRYPYGIVYRIEPEHIYIIAVAHASRAAAYWRARQ
jgi:plasmid stabilization system protein ParE